MSDRSGRSDFHLEETEYARTSVARLGVTASDCPNAYQRCAEMGTLPVNDGVTSGGIERYAVVLVAITRVAVSLRGASGVIASHSIRHLGAVANGRDRLECAIERAPVIEEGLEFVFEGIKIVENEEITEG